MIRPNFVRLGNAAQMLDVDSDALLILKTEDRFRLYWLFNRWVDAARGRIEGSPAQWVDYAVSAIESMQHFMYVPLTRADAGELLKHSAIEAQPHFLSEPDENGFRWRCNTHLSRQVDDEHTRVTRDIVFAQLDDVEALLSQAGTANSSSTSEAPSPPGSAHVSARLALLDQAAKKWWVNADKDDPSTHPSNAQVAAWLEQHGKSRGLSRTQAEVAASIIRPNWAHKGRKPDR